MRGGGVVPERCSGVWEHVQMFRNLKDHEDLDELEDLQDVEDLEDLQELELQGLEFNDLEDLQDLEALLSIELNHRFAWLTNSINETLRHITSPSHSTLAARAPSR